MAESFPGPHSQAGRHEDGTVRGTLYGAGRMGIAPINLYPLSVPSLPNEGVREVAVGEDHAIAITDDGTVLTWGKADRGCLGRNGKPSTPLAPAVPEHLRFTSVACGSHHTGALTESGELWVWGAGAEGQLGNGAFEDVYEPLACSGPEDPPIRSIAMGHNYTAILTEPGYIYVMGGNDVGQLGQCHKHSLCVPTLVKLEHPIRKISCGFKHMLAITEKGRVLMWGLGTDGQLGRGYLSSQGLPRTVDALKGIPVSDGSCGRFHTAVISQSGHLYSWGRSDLVGHNDSSHSRWPSLVSLPEPCRMLVCSEQHTAVVTELSHIYCYGLGFGGRLGLGDEEDQHLPALNVKYVEMTGGRHRRRVEAIAAGKHFTAVVIGCRGSADSVVLDGPKQATDYTHGNNQELQDYLQSIGGGATDFTSWE